MLKRSFAPALALSLAVTTALSAADPVASAAPLWLREPAISPDGKTIAFSYKGDIYVVPASGGRAIPLTLHSAHETRPLWSPDGKTLAFMSDRHGNFDVFTMPASGGNTTRLTTHSADEVPNAFTADGQSLLFSATIRDAVSSSQFPVGYLGELYSVPLTGGHPAQVLTTPAEDASYDRAGNRLVYHDRKGPEDPLRKHHTSSVTRDLWLYDTKAGTHTQLTSFNGEDRTPRFSPDEKSLFYLSEQSGSFNVWRHDLTKPATAPKQITTFKDHPVRSLSLSADGDLVFTYRHESYFQRSGSKTPKLVAIDLPAVEKQNDVRPTPFSGDVTEFSVAPDGKQVAYVIRGEIFVSGVDLEFTKRITDTASQERSVSFSPDGKKLLYAAERDGRWSLYESTLANPAETYFHTATLLKETELLRNDHDNFQPSYSPDGKEIAYLQNRTSIRVYNLEKKESREITPATANYSYSDGDITFEWSPDSQWIITHLNDKTRWSQEVSLVKADGTGQPLNLTRSGYEDEKPRFMPNGKGFFWQTDRSGFRSHGSWGAETDVYAGFWTQAALDRFRLTKDEFALLKEREDKEKADKAKAAASKSIKTLIRRPPPSESKEKHTNPAPEPKPKVAFAAEPDEPEKPDTPPTEPKPDETPKEKSDDAKDKTDDAADKKSDEKKPDEKNDTKPKHDDILAEIDSLENRIVRLTLGSANLQEAALSPDGETLVLISKSEKDFILSTLKLRTKEARTLGKVGTKEKTALALDAKGENAFVLDDGRIARFKIDGSTPPKPIKISAEFNYRPADERAYIFEHAWRQTREKFYVTDLHGVNWDALRTEYARFLPHIDNNRDFAALLSEMLGELNASHTGARFALKRPDADLTASLGAFFDPAHTGPGLKLTELIERGPLTKAATQLKPGHIIEKIDGIEIAPGADYHPLLNRKVEKTVLLSVFDPAANKRWETTVKPIHPGEENALLYQRWVKARRADADRLSSGRIGYIHIQGMNSASFRHTFSELLGRYSDKEAIVIDTRFNSGGWLHDDLATLLTGTPYYSYQPRGNTIGHEPRVKWARPSIVLIGEGNYSNADMFPRIYRDLGIGKLVGMPVPGTGTAVWWETQIDDSLVFGIPQVGVLDRAGKFLENQQFEPDYKVANTSESLAQGRDLQLETAIAELLKTLPPAPAK